MHSSIVRYVTTASALHLWFSDRSRWRACMAWTSALNITACPAPCNSIRIWSVRRSNWNWNCNCNWNYNWNCNCNCQGYVTKIVVLGMEGEIEATVPNERESIGYERWKVNRVPKEKKKYGYGRQNKVTVPNERESTGYERWKVKQIPRKRRNKQRYKTRNKIIHMIDLYKVISNNGD